MGEQRTANIIVLMAGLVGFLLWVFGRLVRIEQAVISNTQATIETRDKVHEQNGRIGRLESWRWQITGAFFLLVAMGPPVFWALGFIHHP